PSVQDNNSEHKNDVDGSTGTNQNRNLQQLQTESTITENKTFLKEIKTFFRDDSSNMPTVKVTFHVHLPSFEYFEGYPIIVGNIEELGDWGKPIVKLKQQKNEKSDCEDLHLISSY